MNIERAAMEEKLLKRTSRHSISLDVSHLTHNLEKEPPVSVSLPRTNTKRNKASFKKIQESETKPEEKKTEQAQQPQQPQREKRTKKKDPKEALKSLSTGDISAAKTDEVKDENKGDQKGKHRKSEVSYSKKVFKFGMIKDDISVKSIHKPADDKPRAVTKKKKKESGKLVKKKPSSSHSGRSNESEKKQEEKKTDEEGKKFVPLGQLEEEDFEGMDLTQLNQFERVNMQVNRHIHISLYI